MKWKEPGSGIGGGGWWWLVVFGGGGTAAMYFSANTIQAVKRGSSFLLPREDGLDWRYGEKSTRVPFFMS